VKKEKLIFLSSHELKGRAHTSAGLLSFKAGVIYPIASNQAFEQISPKPKTDGEKVAWCLAPEIAEEICQYIVKNWETAWNKTGPVVQFKKALIKSRTFRNISDNKDRHLIGTVPIKLITFVSAICRFQNINLFLQWERGTMKLRLGSYVIGQGTDWKELFGKTIRCLKQTRQIEKYMEKSHFEKIQATPVSNTAWMLSLNGVKKYLFLTREEKSCWDMKGSVDNTPVSKKAKNWKILINDILPPLKEENKKQTLVQE
jgi:hypothetical protein